LESQRPRDLASLSRGNSVNHLGNASNRKARPFADQGRQVRRTPHLVASVRRRRARAFHRLARPRRTEPSAKAGYCALELARDWRLWGKFDTTVEAQAGFAQKSALKPMSSARSTPRTRAFLRGAAGNRRIPRAFSCFIKLEARKKLRAAKRARIAYTDAHAYCRLGCVR